MITINWDDYLKQKAQDNAYKVSIPDPFVAPGIPTGYEDWTPEQFAAKFGPDINFEEEMI
jgi:hypothetical protein